MWWRHSPIDPPLHSTEISVFLVKLGFLHCHYFCHVADTVPVVPIVMSQGNTRREEVEKLSVSALLNDLRHAYSYATADLTSSHHIVICTWTWVVEKHKNVWESWLKVPTADVYQSILGTNPAEGSCHVSSLSLPRISLLFTFNFLFLPSPTSDLPNCLLPLSIIEVYTRPVHYGGLFFQSHIKTSTFNWCYLAPVFLSGFTDRDQSHLQLPLQQASERSCQHLTASRSYVGPQDVEQWEAGAGAGEEGPEGKPCAPASISKT